MLALTGLRLQDEFQAGNIDEPIKFGPRLRRFRPLDFRGVD